METATARYLEYMVHEFHKGLINSLSFKVFTKDELDSIYALGYNFFVLGRFQAAKDIFNRLTAYDPLTAFYWRALGAVNQQMKNYPEAIAAYSNAIAVDGTDVISYVYRGESYILSGNIKEAIKDFEKGQEIGARDPQAGPWVNRSNMLIKLQISRIEG
jgi:type III secretion system low calcium response chaperone LcrH/SycD